MASRRNKRLPKNVLQEDLKAYAALQAIANYNPANEEFSLAAITAVKTSMEGRQTTEVQQQAAADAARDGAMGGEWDYHDKILGAKNQVKAQFGEDSDEYASLGLKKKSEYKTGRRKASTTGDATP
jgi:hypothetical protein